jgi:hypothetical protein
MSGIGTDRRDQLLRAMGRCKAWREQAEAKARESHRLAEAASTPTMQRVWDHVTYINGARAERYAQLYARAVVELYGPDGSDEPARIG